MFIFCSHRAPSRLVILVGYTASCTNGDLFLQLAVFLGEPIVFTVQALRLRLDCFLILLFAIQVGGQFLDTFPQLVELENELVVSIGHAEMEYLNCVCVCVGRY